MTPVEFRSWLSNAPTAAPGGRRRTLVMGVLNATPDSFSDGGQFTAIDRAVDRVRAMIEEGADLIDVGGESTRPGAEPVDSARQIERIVPLLGAVRRLTEEGRLPQVTISVDTTRAEVARAALDAGAHVVNDISAGRDDPAMLPLVAGRRVPVILMHMQGTPATMQADPRYADVTGEVAAFLRERTAAAVAAGVSESDVLLDPGIGFGKTIEHNLELLRRMGELCTLGRPLVVGTSRKGFIGRITGETEASHRLFGTAATVAWSTASGASIVRVHDVRAMSQVVRMIGAIQFGGDAISRAK